MKRATLLLTTLLASISLSATTFANEGKSFSDLDKDGDRNLSRQELQEAGKNVNINELDEDNDGVISQSEYEKHKEKKKGNR